MFYKKTAIIFMVIASIGNFSFGQSLFKESALAWGVEHFHRGIMGGGVAIFDYNNDGFLDLYFTGGVFQDELFKNNGNRTFTKISNYAGLTVTSSYNTMAVVSGDINNDGFSDLFVATDKGKRDLLFLNNTDGTFSEIGKEAGISGNQWGMGATFADFNLDGFLDIYVINYVQSHQAIVDENSDVIGFDHLCYPNNLYINNGDLTFTETSVASSTDNKGCGLAVAASDINNDNIPDIYIANDFGAWVKPNVGLVNNYPDSQFSEVGATAGIDAAIYGMGIAVGDYDRDGLLDYYVSNLGANILYKNLGDGNFSDEAQHCGVLNAKVDDKLATSWGTAFFDYDLDGFEDLFVSNGYIPAASFIGNTKEDPNKLYKNRGDGTFEDVSELQGVADTKIGRGMAVGDLDNDGDLDLVVAIIGTDDDAGNVLIYENVVDNSNHWLNVMLTGVDANRDGYGAKIKAYHNGTTWIEEINGGSSHVSQNSKIAHFGLGSVDVVDSLVVVWPGGKTQKYSTISADQTIHISENATTYDVVGCMNAGTENYNANATYDLGCYIHIEGCLNQDSPYFNPEANVESGECAEVVNALDDTEQMGLSLSPNPMTETLTISFNHRSNDEYHMQLLDPSGKVIRSARFRNSMLLERDNLPAGLYILRIASKDSQVARKVVIE